MNMCKLGTVSRSEFGHENQATPRKYRAGSVTTYTLCE